MPLYEYRCSQCGKVAEVLRPIRSRDDAMDCRWCGAGTERIVSKFNTVTIDNTGKLQEGTDAGSVTIADCGFENMQTGISIAKGTRNVHMVRNTFKNVVQPIRVTDE